ncbi:MAG: LL-diaminopimelate aminotransferase [Candidatus Omnitrophota bacterium]|nr:MAG: LL-diaminopimelate aminotransferase [Candidatus Omnitrophota bacterium]
MNISLSHRLKKLPPYLFSELGYLKEEIQKQGKDVIDLGVGDPDLPTPEPIVKQLCVQARKKENQFYSSPRGLFELRQAISEWYRKRFNIFLDPETEVLPLIGSKEGIAHLPLAFLNPQDLTLVPDPAYPPYRTGTILAGGIPYSLPLLRENRFLPALNKIRKEIAQRAKILFLNYPNNPTSAFAPADFLKEVVEFAKRYEIIVCYDNAYSEIYFDNLRPGSFLEIKGAKDVGVEFHSLSKTYNMSGWRIGWVCGNREVIEALAKVKSNIDSGLFLAIQRAGIVALSLENKKEREVYKRRRDVMLEGLRSLGFEVEEAKATFYLWVHLPKNFTSSLEFSQKLLKEQGVMVTPGVGFGEYGEGYFRVALTVSESRLKEAIERIRLF